MPRASHVMKSSLCNYLHITFIAISLARAAALPPLLLPICTFIDDDGDLQTEPALGPGDL